MTPPDSKDFIYVKESYGDSLQQFKRKLLYRYTFHYNRNVIIDNCVNTIFLEVCPEM